ncbi:hypothetical protein OROMI_022017 [Orobanche minor]
MTHQCKENKMIIVEKRFVDGSASSSPEEEPYQIYNDNIDISKMPWFFRKYDDVEDGVDDGIYMFPGDDTELLNMCHTPKKDWYHVDIRSVEDACLFYAELNEEEAVKLKGQFE